MLWKLRKQQLKAILYIYMTIIEKPNGNHKPKIFNKYAQ